MKGKQFIGGKYGGVSGYLVEHNIEDMNNFSQENPFLLFNNQSHLQMGLPHTVEAQNYLP